MNPSVKSRKAKLLLTIFVAITCVNIGWFAYRNNAIFNAVCSYKWHLRNVVQLQDRHEDIERIRRNKTNTSEVLSPKQGETRSQISTRESKPVETKEIAGDDGFRDRLTGQSDQNRKYKNEKPGMQSPLENLEENLMKVVSKERLAGLERGCHVNNKAYDLDIDYILKLPQPNRPRFYFSDKYKLLLCEVPKCGSTNWKKAILTMEGVEVGKKMPSKIRGDEAHAFGSLLSVWKNYNESDPQSVAKAKQRISNYTRVMTVREPLERLVSAYRDKMLPTGTGGSPFGAMSQRIHKAYNNDNNTKNEENSGVDVAHASWKEFVRYLLDKNRKIYIDAHWQMFSKMCYPCKVTYDHIAKLETIYYDAKYLTSVLGFDLTQYFPDSTAQSRKGKWSTEYQKYFEDLPKQDRDELYDMYMEQYDLFGYSKPNFL